MHTNLKKIVKEYYILFALAGMFVVLSLATPNFARPSNIATFLRQSSVIAVVACGQCFVMLSGFMDLSVGSIVGLCGVVFAYLIVELDLPIIIGILAIMLLGICFGLINSYMITILKMPGFIATLATMGVGRGFAYVITNSTPIAPLPEAWGWIGRGVIGDMNSFGVPIPVIIMVVLYIIATIITERTKFGRHFYALGGNSEAAYLSGIDTNRQIVFAFLLSGILSAFGGLILASRLNSGHMQAGNGFEFETITACVIGGISINGGKGKVINAMLGAIFLTMLFNGMTLLNVNTYYQDVFRGIVLAVAVGINTFRNREKN